MAPSPDVEDPEISLLNAVEDLQNEAQIPAKQRAIKITGVVNRVSTKSYEFGLPSDILETVIDIITLPNELDQASIGSLIRNLYPAARVNNDCVIKVVGALGLGQIKPTFSAQTNLLKWLVMVYDVLENQKILSQLYSHLFNLLDVIAIRAPLCHLLSLITRRAHVRPFRIQALLELARKVGNEPQLVGLIRVYKDYYPDVIVGDATAGRASVFKHPNLEWGERLSEIQYYHAQRSQAGPTKSGSSFKVVRRGINGVKRSKVSVVPEVRTSQAQESSTTLEEIENVDSFISKLEKIDLPNQLVAVLGDPLLQKFLQLVSTDVIEERINHWLSAFFEDQVSEASNSYSESLDMLQSISEYARFTKTVPPACVKFLEALLPEWNGITGREVILDLLSYMPVEIYSDLDVRIFKPLENALLDGSPTSQISLLNYYTQLFDHWTFTLLSSPPPPHTSSTITALATHINSLTSTILQTSPTIQAHSHILTFYEATAALHTHISLQSHVRITTPPAALIYSLHFSSSLSSLSRLCAILALFKRSFESAMSFHTSKSAASTPVTPNFPSSHIEPYPKEYVNHFNGFLMDICNCLWRSRAFNTSDVNALGCLLPPSLLSPLTNYVADLDQGLALPSLFSLSYSPLLCYQSISYFRDVEEDMINKAETGQGREIGARQKGPVTAASLKSVAKEGGAVVGWPEYRLGVLRYLEKEGVRGVGELMYNTMKHLMQSRPDASTQK